MHLNALAQVINRHCGHGPHRGHVSISRNRIKQAANQAVPFYHSEKLERKINLSVEAYSLLSTNSPMGLYQEATTPVGHEHCHEPAI